MKLNNLEHRLLQSLHADGFASSVELFRRLRVERGQIIRAYTSLMSKGLVTRSGHDLATGQLTAEGAALAARVEDAEPPAKVKKPPLGINPETGGTRYPGKVDEIGPGTTIFQPGKGNFKLGWEVRKGEHSGRRIHSLTLEEGKTCPPCDLEAVCYGGNMHRAKRLKHGPRLEALIGPVLKGMEHPALIRLHVLGDFYDLAYTRSWTRVWSKIQPVFGYTHHKPSSRIGEEIARTPWERFAVRFSADKDSEVLTTRAAVTIDSPEEAEKFDAVVCPQQEGKQVSCAECGYCWTTERNVAFLRH